MKLEDNLFKTISDLSITILFDILSIELFLKMENNIFYLLKLYKKPVYNVYTFLLIALASVLVSAK